MSQNSRSWTPNQTEFIRWLATSRYERIPPSQETFAESIGVNRKTLYRWGKLEGFQEAVAATSREMLEDNLPEIYGALVREAEKGSFQHIKLALELAGEYVEKQQREISGPVRTYAIVSPADFRDDD